MILRAAWIFPVTSPPIRDGIVEVCEGRIVRVGRADEGGLGARGDSRTSEDGRAAEDGPGDVVHYVNALLLPGLINPHTHLELAAYAGRLAPGRFWRWLEQLVALRRQPGRTEREQAAVAAAATESLRWGVTCVGDISRRNLAWPVLKTIPIRKVSFVELLTLADDPPRDPTELRDAVRKVDEDDLLTVGVTPHAPYTVRLEHAQAAVHLAQEIGRPWTMHLAETREEVAWLRGDASHLPPMLRDLQRQCGVRSPGASADDYLRRVAGECRPGAIAHGNYFDDRDIAAVAARGDTVVYCPRAHGFFGHDPYPLARLIAAGVPVAVGTDSAAGQAGENPTSILHELQFLLMNLPDAPAVDELLRMATLNAGRALGLEDRIGSLEPGKFADLVVFPVDASARDPLADLLRHPREPLAVYVAGQRIDVRRVAQGIAQRSAPLRSRL